MVDDGGIAPDITILFQTLQPRLHRRLGQADAAAKLGGGQPAVFRQSVQDFAVDTVQSI